MLATSSFGEASRMSATKKSHCRCRCGARRECVDADASQAPPGGASGVALTMNACMPHPLAVASVAEGLTPACVRHWFRCRATCSALVGRPRRGRESSATTKATGRDIPSTWAANQRSTSSARQSKRLVPGRRQIGGRDCGLRVASLRMLAIDLCRQTDSCSTVISSFIKEIPRRVDKKPGRILSPRTIDERRCQPSAADVIGQRTNHTTN